MRAFNYWLLTECHSILAQEQDGHLPSNDEGNNNAHSPFVRRREHKTDTSDPEDRPWPPFELLPDITIYMYCTCAPCGDASMELCMAAQEDATPWEVPSGHPSHADENTSRHESDNPVNELLDGRAHFSRLGVVRRKPARMDAESTRSKSCSDKLALRQVSSLLSYETSLLVAPTRNAYLAGLILPEAEISQEGCERSFGESGRMKALNGSTWPTESGNSERHGYRFQPFTVLSIPNSQLSQLWAFGKPAPPAAQEPAPNGAVQKKSKPSNVSAIWAVASSGTHPLPRPDHGARTLPVLRGSRTGLYETIINGVRQGSRATSPVPRGASALSRAKLWGLLRDVLMLLGSSLAVTSEEIPPVEPACSSAREEDNCLRKRVLEATTYHEFKKASLGSEGWINARSEAIQDARKVLKGWIPNSGDEGWGLDVLVDPKKRKRDELP